MEFGVSPAVCWERCAETVECPAVPFMPLVMRGGGRGPAACSSSRSG